MIKYVAKNTDEGSSSNHNSQSQRRHRPYQRLKSQSNDFFPGFENGRLIYSPAVCLVRKQNISIAKPFIRKCHQAILKNLQQLLNDFAQCSGSMRCASSALVKRPNLRMI